MSYVGCLSYLLYTLYQYSNGYRTPDPGIRCMAWNRPVGSLGNLPELSTFRTRGADGSGGL